MRRGERLVTLPLERVVIGDHMIVKPGDRIPLDGVIVEGESGIDQSQITGESIPVNKGPGDTVLAGSIVRGGSLDVAVTRLAADSTIARLIHLVEEAQSEKAETQRFIDRAEQYYALGVILMTAAAIAIPPLFLGEPFNTAFYRAMTLMVAASPCALVISTPATVLSAIGNGATAWRALFKGGATWSSGGGDQGHRLRQDGARDHRRAESHRRYPAGLCRGTATGARRRRRSAQRAPAGPGHRAQRQRRASVPESSDFRSHTGHGVRASVDGHTVAVGSLRYFRDFDAAASGRPPPLSPGGRRRVERRRRRLGGRRGRRTARPIGVIGIADVLPDAPAVVRRL